MLKRTTLAFAAAAGIVAFGGAALAQPAGYGRTPSTSDFEVCNRDAEINRGSSVSASPQTSAPSVPGAGLGAAGATGSPASGAAAGSAAGATGGTGSLSGGSTLGADTRQSDPSYQQAYRDCLKRRGY